MYGWIWAHLPGGRLGRLAQAVTLAMLAAAILWFVVFPWLGPRLPLDRVSFG